MDYGSWNPSNTGLSYTLLQFLKDIDEREARLLGIAFGGPRPQKPLDNATTRDDALQGGPPKDQDSDNKKQDSSKKETNQRYTENKPNVKE